MAVPTWYQYFTPRSFFSPLLHVHSTLCPLTDAVERLFSLKPYHSHHTWAQYQTHVQRSQPEHHVHSHLHALAILILISTDHTTASSREHPTPLTHHFTLHHFAILSVSFFILLHPSPAQPTATGTRRQAPTSTKLHNFAILSTFLYLLHLSLTQHTVPTAPATQIALTTLHVIAILCYSTINLQKGSQRETQSAAFLYNHYPYNTLRISAILCFFTSVIYLPH